MDHVKQARTGELFSLLGLGALGAVGVAAAHPHVKHHLLKYIPTDHHILLSKYGLVPRLDSDFVEYHQLHKPWNANSRPWW